MIIPQRDTKRQSFESAIICKAMEIHTNIPLKNLTTIRLGGPTRFFVEVHSAEDLRSVYKNALTQNIKPFVIGGGSNLIAHDEGYSGIIIRIRIPGFEITSEDAGTTTIKIGAGEDWDEIVKRTVELNLSGIEAMSGIPGTAGATPVQNVGAYGQEIADTLISVDAYDTSTDSFVTLDNSSCEFSYRHSIFRGNAAGRYIITSITLKLSKSIPAPPFYESLQKYLEQNNITIYTQQTIRDAVLAIRADKLPDVKEKASAGSFFKNALVEKWQLDSLKKQFPEIPSYDMGEGKYKIPTGWLIEKAGLKGQLLHGIRVYEGNALVLVNESATSYADLASARDEIIAKIRDLFQIHIEQEPLELT